MSYDEMGMFAENAAEVGLAWRGQPTVSRVDVPTPKGRVSALVWGEAPAELVLIHGGAQNAHTWDTVALALERPLVALDLPGHGHSDWWEDHDYTPEALAEAVAVAIAHLAPEAQLVAGMSLGGLTSICLAAAHPELVRRLVVVDVTPGTDHAKAEPIITFISGPERFADFDEILKRTIEHNPTRSEASLRRRVLHNARPEPEGTWVWRWGPVRDLGAGGGEGGEKKPELSGAWGGGDAGRAPTTLVGGGGP